MKVFIQRVSSAAVSVADEVVGSIGPGLLLLVGFGAKDNASILQPMAEKIMHMRIFSDEAGRFQHSVLETEGSVLAVPQFTLYADTRKGRRPEFFSAAKPELASALFDEFVGTLRALSAHAVETGRFGAHMQVRLENDGPVSIMLEREAE